MFALGAGKLFDIHHAGEFEETILGKSARANAAIHHLPVTDRLAV